VEATVPEIARALARLPVPPRRIGTSLIIEPTVSSTNDVAAARAAAGGPEGLVVIAETQTAGRGRLGRTWSSPPGVGLYVSVVLRPDPGVAGLLTLAGGVALAEAIRECTGLAVDIKWPNDLLAPGSGRKLAGILVEGSASGGRLEHAIFGYGINVRRGAYPLEVRERATSLEEELGRAVDPAQLLVFTLAALDRRYDDLVEGRAPAVLARWQELAPRANGAAVEWREPGVLRRGVTAGIADDGALLVRTAAGLDRIVAGDVTWL
jgi:BirA family transcriptional regulator, biotin operon repressor / biotin---[acetyl-CoA-carboxylase] ligase